jgi:hypothetical protein
VKYRTFIILGDTVAAIEKALLPGERVVSVYPVRVVSVPGFRTGQTDLECLVEAEVEFSPAAFEEHAARVTGKRQ